MRRFLLLGASIVVVLLVVAQLGSTAILAAEEAEPGPDYEQLKVFEWMIGDWEGTIKVPPGFQEIYPDGATVLSQQSIYWMQNKNYLGFKFRDTADGEVLHEGFEMTGVDPKSKKLVQWIFSVAGGNGKGKWSKRGKGWQLKWQATLPNGAEYKGTSYLVSVDENTHTWTMKNLTRNGEKMPDYPLVTLRRVKGKKAGK